MRTPPTPKIDVSDQKAEHRPTSTRGGRWELRGDRRPEEKGRQTKYLPMTYYACIIGCNQEWPEQRCLLGDIALARTLVRDCRLPTENLVEVYDEYATRSNVLRALEILLDRRNAALLTTRGRDDGGGIGDNDDDDDDDAGSAEAGGGEENDTLLLHYGGHGKREYFCTQRSWLGHAEIIDLLERKFRGGTVVALIDCCHSGGFGEAVVRERDGKKGALNANYACIMSAAPGDKAGMEWTMSELFLRAFKGELLCPPNDRGANDKDQWYYLYGKHPKDKWSEPTTSDTVAANEAKIKNGWTHPTWEQVVDFFVNEMARIKGGWATTFFLWNKVEDKVPFLRGPCIFGNNIKHISHNLSARLPRDETWMDPYLRKNLSVNDCVYVKCRGEQHLGWLSGQIISINRDSSMDSTTNNENERNSTNVSTANIRLFDTITKAQYTITTAINSPPSFGNDTIVLGGLPFAFGFGFEPKYVIRVITSLSRSLAYYDTTVPPNIDVEVKWKDGEYYKARTLCVEAIPWKRVCLDSSPKVIGPCVPLCWEDDNSVTFVPTSACRMEDKSKLSCKSARDAGAESIVTPMDAMFASLACSGKTLHGDAPILDSSVIETDADFWEAYDPEDGHYSRIQLMNKVDPTLLPLNVLSHHMCYRESGSYSVVYWESESMLTLIPTGHLGRRGKDDSDSSDSDGSDSDTSDSSDNDSSDDEEYH